MQEDGDLERGCEHILFGWRLMTKLHHNLFGITVTTLHG